MSVTHDWARYQLRRAAAVSDRADYVVGRGVLWIALASGLLAVWQPIFSAWAPVVLR
jgi:hypothetical protein